MAAIKITGFDPDAHERPDPEPSPRTVRRRTESERPAPGPPPRQVRKPVDAKTAEHLRIKYGMQNVKFTEIAPKKSTSTKNYRSGSTAKGGGARLSAVPEKEESPAPDSVALAEDTTPSDDGG